MTAFSIAAVSDMARHMSPEARTYLALSQDTFVRDFRSAVGYYLLYGWVLPAAMLGLTCLAAYLAYKVLTE